MKFTTPFLVIVLSVVFCFGYTPSYFCYPDLCKQSPYEKIACGNYETIQCSGGKVISLTKNLRTFIVHIHNNFRNEIASGQLSGFDKAARMATMAWDFELAYLAELHANRCIFSHDCHKYPKYPYSGQNVGLEIYPVEWKIDIKNVMNGTIHRWYNENVHLDNQAMKSFTPRPPSWPKVGHFTALVQEKNHRIGCALITYPGVRTQNFMFTCNYSYNNMAGEPVYTSTDGTPGSGCVTGTNRKNSALCSIDESYNVQ